MRFLNWIISILIIIILLGFVIGFNLFGIGTLTDRGIGAIKTTYLGMKNTINTGKCPDFIIPERMIIVEEPVRKEIMNRWKDGTEITYFSSPWCFGNSFECVCRSGSFEGENKNYYYCNGLAYVRAIQETDSKGGILRNIIYNYSTNLILKPEGNWTILEEPPSLEREMMTEEEIHLIEENVSNLPAIFIKVMNHYGIYKLDASYVNGQEEKWVQVNGEVWVANANDLFRTSSIYRNYSILNPTCTKN